jgi:hypothetical protein
MDVNLENFVYESAPNSIRKKNFYEKLFETLFAIRSKSLQIFDTSKTIPNPAEILHLSLSLKNSTKHLEQV